MERDQLLALRDKLLNGDPPYVRDGIGKPSRRSGNRGLVEQRALGDYDTSASFLRLVGETVLSLIDERLSRMRK